MRRVAVCNLKGGTGKTTTAVNVAHGFAQAGERTLLIDADAQASATASLGVEPGPTLAHLLTGQAELREVIRSAREHLDVIPASGALASLSDVLSARLRREEVLARALAPLRGYKWVIIDCAPSYSLLNLNVLVWAAEIWAPVSTDFLALAGLGELLETVALIEREHGHRLRLTYVIPTFHAARTRKSTEAIETLRGRFGPVVSDPIRYTVKLAEAPGRARTIWEHAPTSAGAEDYARLVRRIANGQE